MRSDAEIVVRSGRRAFLKHGTLVLSATAINSSLFGAGEQEPVLKVGLVTDLHYADKRPAGSRHYRETPDKLADAAERYSKDKPTFLVELGDFIDAADTVETELGYLTRINRDFSAICKERHYILGNHCVDMLRKEEFLDAVEQRWSPWWKAEAQRITATRSWRSNRMARFT